MRLGSLFSGYGGLCELAVAPLLGASVAWHCDNDPAAAKVLAHRWPGTPNLGDITAVDWTQVEAVDVLCGGFPCQDISDAGHRVGITGARSGLWTQFADAIRHLRPRYVLVENVAALVNRGLDRVLADLAACGFDAEWAIVRASDVGAAHRRDRLFLAATADTADHGPVQAGRAWGRRSGPAHSGAPVAVAKGDGRQQGRTEPTGQLRRPDAAQRGAHDWGVYTAAVRHWAGVLGRTAPAPTMDGQRGARVLNPVFVEWLMGLPAGHVTAVPGPSRTDMLRLLGNGVVPQQATAALGHLLHQLDERCAA